MPFLKVLIFFSLVDLWKILRVFYLMFSASYPTDIGGTKSNLKLYYKWVFSIYLVNLSNFRKIKLFSGSAFKIKFLCLLNLLCNCSSFKNLCTSLQKNSHWILSFVFFRKQSSVSYNFYVRSFISFCGSAFFYTYLRL